MSNLRGIVDALIETWRDRDELLVSFREFRASQDAWYEQAEASPDYEPTILPALAGTRYVLAADCRRCGALVFSTAVHDSWHAVLRERTLTEVERGL